MLKERSLTFLTGIPSGYKQCSDGILGPTEECDDGNLVSNDGCSPDCRLEDKNLYKCVNLTTFGPTECCVAKVNPVTQQRVCNCKNQASDNPGYSISEDCRSVAETCLHRKA